MDSDVERWDTSGMVVIRAVKCTNMLSIGMHSEISFVNVPKFLVLSRSKKRRSECHQFSRVFFLLTIIRDCTKARLNMNDLGCQDKVVGT